MMRETFDRESRLSWVLAGLAGLLGAAAFTHSSGYFVTFMTGNVNRAALGYFRNEGPLAVAALLLMIAFLGGVVSGSLGRRHIWPTKPHGVTVLTTSALLVATVLDYTVCGGPARPLSLLPIWLVTFGIGALNTTFVKDGEVSVALSYVTGTVVKLGQGIERHINGGEAADWLGYLLLYASYAVGIAVGGWIGLVVSGSAMLVAATVISGLTTGYAYLYVDRHGVFGVTEH